MIKLMGIAKGLNPKKIVKEAMDTQELAEEYAKEIESMMEQLDNFEEEMTQELSAQKQQTGDVMYDQIIDSMSRYVGDAQKNLEELVTLMREDMSTQPMI